MTKLFAVYVDRPLTDNEKRILGRFEGARDGKNMEMSLVGYALARFALQKTFSLPFDGIKFEKGEHGKPYISNQQVYFSISHSEKLCICAVSDSEIGADVEYIKRQYSDRIMKKYFTADERKYTENGDDNGRAGRFFEIWTQKESIVKYTGAGLAEFSKSKPEGVSVKSVRIFGDYVASVCELTKLS